MVSYLGFLSRKIGNNQDIKKDLRNYDLRPQKDVSSHDFILVFTNSSGEGEGTQIPNDPVYQIRLTPVNRIL